MNSGGLRGGAVEGFADSPFWDRITGGEALDRLVSVRLKKTVPSWKADPNQWPRLGLQVDLDRSPRRQRMAAFCAELLPRPT
jgi:hypothetical protein